MTRAKLFPAQPFARVGKQDYRASELGQPGDALVIVDRPAEEVAASAPSFEGVPVTVDHPPTALDAETAEQAAVGLVSGVQFDDTTGQLRGDFLLWDAEAIRAVADGLRELSAGYQADYEPVGAGGFRQRNIRGNHVALVERGRAGSAVRIGG